MVCELRWSMRRGTKATWALLSPWSLAILFMVLASASGSSMCGDYYQVGSSEPVNIYSPSYPDFYPTYSKCIWLVEVPTDHRVRVSITYEGERYNGECSDYVEVRDGGRYAPLLGRFCDSVNQYQVTSGNIWMWLMFKSDGINGTGSLMHSAFIAVYNNTTPDNTTLPYTNCRSYEFECRNKECLSISYRCDGYNDCGCLEDCDEDGCSSLSISKGAQVGIALGVGVAVFCLVCLIDFIIEGKNTWLAAQAEAMREKEMLAEKQRQRANRAFTKFIGGYNETFSKPDANTSNKAAPNKKSPELAITDFDA